MKIKLFIIVVSSFIFILIGNVSATLIDRGGGLIYDDYFDITWLQDANFARTTGYNIDGKMYWFQGMEWADNLIYYDSIRDVTYDDWRLPTILNQSILTDWNENGYNQTTSEMGHLFYVDLANSIGSLNHIGPFVNLQPYMYWTGTRTELLPNYAWYFNFGLGAQSIHPSGINDLTVSYVWAVRDGDVSSPVPEPNTFILLCIGMITVLGIKLKSNVIRL